MSAKGSESGNDGALDLGSTHGTEPSCCHDVLGTVLAGALRMPQLIRGGNCHSAVPASPCMQADADAHSLFDRDASQDSTPCDENAGVTHALHKQAGRQSMREAFLLHIPS